MWHFDGSKWTNTHLSDSEGGLISGLIILFSVYGFNSTDVYAVGARLRYTPNPPPNHSNYIGSSLIIHYDGFFWQEVGVISGDILRGIQGSSANDIWAGGRYNTLYHYDGSIWKRDSVEINVPVNQSFHIESVATGNSGTYLMGYRSFPGGSDLVSYFFKRNNSTWVKIDSSNFYSYKFFRSPSGTLYYAGQGGVFKNIGNQWTSIFTVNQFIVSMSASSDENIFAAGQGGGGRVYHYNGIDWKEIEQLSNTQAEYFAVWTDGNEVFVVGHIFDAPSQKTIVWHGK